MKRPTIISVVNHKGGVLKTSLTASLGASLARLGRKVLLLDLDAQQNLTQSLIGPVITDENQTSLYDALVDEEPLDELIRGTSLGNLDIIPCTEKLAGLDLSLANAVARESILKGCFGQTRALSTYDLILIDNPPSIALVVANSLVASDYFLVPCSAEYLPMVGLALLGNSIGRLLKLAPNLRPLGVVLTLFARSERICQQVERAVTRDLGPKLFRTKIRVNTKAKSAPAKQKTIFEFEANEEGRGTQDYTALAYELLERLEAEEREDLRLAANV